MPPPFINWTTDASNQTLHNDFEEVSFLTILKDLGPAMVLVPVVAILEQVAIAKAFCKFRKYILVCHTTELHLSVRCNS